MAKKKSPAPHPQAASSNGTAVLEPPPLPPAVDDAAPIVGDVVHWRSLMVDVEAIVPSPLNPRKHFDPVKLTELASSLRRHGVLEPLIVRVGVNDDDIATYELVAGERRWRAAKLAGLPNVPVRVIDIDDAQMVELMMIENLQRDDLTPLEEGRGYRALIDSAPDKHSALSISLKIGKSVAYVWDRIKLLDLVTPAQQLLEEGRISVGHAILIARLTPEQQQKVIGWSAEEGFEDVRWDRSVGLWCREDGELFARDEEQTLADADETRNPLDEVKPCSVKELERHIATHIRFDPKQAAEAAPLLFEETAAMVEEAEAQPGRGKKFIAITHEYRVADDAKDPATRTYGSASWKRADGKKGPTCEHSILGLVVAGAEYGKAFQVCIAKDKCKVHWEAEQKEKAKRAKKGKSGSGGGGSTSAPSWEKEEKRQAAVWKKIKAEAIELVIENVVAASPGEHVAALAKWWYVKPSAMKEAQKQLPDQAGTLILARLLSRAADGWVTAERFQDDAGKFGAGLAPLIKKAKAEVLAAEKAAEAKPAAKSAKKTGKKKASKKPKRS